MKPNTAESGIPSWLHQLGRLIAERLPDGAKPRPWMAHAYYDYMRRCRVMVVYPLHWVVMLAWRLNHSWARHCNKPSWIDGEVERRVKAEKEKAPPLITWGELRRMVGK